MGRKGESSAATGSRRAARERLRAERERQAQIQQRRDRIVKLSIAGVVVLTLVAIAGIVWWQSSQSDTATPARPPAGAAWGYEEGAGAPGMTNGIGVGAADAAVVVELFEDFLCPHCASFENDARDVIDDAVENGTARFVYYPVTLPSFGQPTVDAANAYGCAVDEGRGQEYHDALYGASGTQWDDDQLIALGESLGLTSETFGSCVEDGTFEPWVHSIDGADAQRRIEQTPTVVVNGEQLEDTTGAGLRIAIEQAAEGPDEGSADGDGSAADE